MAKDKKTCIVIIDSDSRFDEKDGEPLYINLPHDKHGWNRFVTFCVNDSIYYKNKKVIDLKEIKHCYKGIHTNDGSCDLDGSEPYDYRNLVTKKYEYDWYYLYVSDGNISQEDKEWIGGGRFLENTILYFDGKCMTNAHIHFEILR